LAGSYAIESMTSQIEAEAGELMAKVTELGGAVAAIEQGFQKAEIERSAYRIAREIDSGERKGVGVNAYVSAQEEHYEPLRVNPAIEQEQGARLADLRDRRDGAEVSRRLDELKRMVAGDGNLLYPVREALRELATVG